MRDFSPVFDDIIEAWTEGNAEKFEGSEGTERFGFTPDPDVFWKEVTEPYYRQKHGPIDYAWYEERGFPPRRLYPDHLMVRTGELRDSLTHRGSFAEAILEDRAVFGFPMDYEAGNALLGNWSRSGRQVMYLGELDRDMISSKINQFIRGEGKYYQEPTGGESGEAQEEFGFPEATQ